MSLSLQNRHEEEECKKVLITGSNQGIGLATAIALAKKGDYNITLACRNEARAQAAVKTVREAAAQVISKDVQVRYVLVDLAQLESVHKLLANFRASGEFFDVVVLNAGVLLPSDRITVDGVESSFQVNFVSQFLLVRELIAYQCPEHPLRVVTVGNLFN